MLALKLIMKWTISSHKPYATKPSLKVSILYYTTYILQQWRGESEAAGEAARLMAPPPPQSYFFASWCHVESNDHRSLRNTFGWMGALQAPQQFQGRVLVGSSKESAS